MSYHVYIVECADGTLYTGIAVDVPKRVGEHNESAKGAKYTRSRRPVLLRYIQKCRTRSSALRREAAIKRLTRAEKWHLIHESKQP